MLLKAFIGFYDTPELDGIRFLTYPDAAASWLPFTNGDIDIAEVPAGEVEAAREKYGDAGFRPFLATYSFGLNIKSPQLDDIRVRRAINKAIDRPTIVQTVYRGTMEPPRGILPTGMPGFLENICVGTCEFDPDGAARLVAGLKRRDRALTLAFSGDQPHPQVARMVRSNLEDAAVLGEDPPLSLPPLSQAFAIEGPLDVPARLDSGVPAPDAYLTPLFGSRSPDNHSGLTSERVDSLLERARATPSDGKRIQLYVQAEKAIMELLPLAPIGSFVTHWAAQPDVEGFVFDQLGGFDVVGISIAEE